VYLAAREREGVVAEIALGAPGTPNDHVMDLARRAPGHVHTSPGLSLTGTDTDATELRRSSMRGHRAGAVRPKRGTRPRKRPSSS